MKEQNILPKKGKTIKLPNNIEAGDIIVAKFNESKAGDIPWENWHHAGLISKVDGTDISIIEAPGKPGNNKVGPIENTFDISSFGDNDIIEIALLKPIFPDPIREKDSWYVPRIMRGIISEDEARKKMVKYARNQIGEDYSIGTSKWNDDFWYCSKLVYKPYSMTVTGMYLETYYYPNPLSQVIRKMSSGYYVTPEDLIDSKRTEMYYHFIKE